MGASVSAEPGESTFSLDVLAPDNTPLEIPPEVAVKVRPVTLQREAALGLSTDGNILARFSPISFEALTSFFAFHLDWKAPSGKVLRSNFVLNLPLSGAPENRKERILQGLLENKDQVLRLLLLLLAEEGLHVIDFTNQMGGPGHGKPPLSYLGQSTLLESLLKALDRHPSSVEQVARIIEDLRKTPKGRELIPDGFETIWSQFGRPIRSSRYDGKREATDVEPSLTASRVFREPLSTTPLSAFTRQTSNSAMPGS